MSSYAYILLNLFLVATICNVYFTRLAIKNLKSGGGYWFYMSHLDAAYRSKYYTPEGNRYRIRALIALFFGLLILIIFMFVGAATE